MQCDSDDAGCNGGDTITAYKYVEKAGGLALESTYKDTSAKSGNTGKCKRGFHTAGGKPKGYSYATKPCNFGKCNKANLNLLASNVASKAPASICVNAGKWQNYKTGVLTSKKCGSHASSALDHCVQLVGMDLSASTPYWKVRNSWGTSWGEDGFIRLEYGKSMCALDNDPTTVVPELA